MQLFPIGAVNEWEWDSQYVLAASDELKGDSYDDQKNIRTLVSRAALGRLQ